MKSGPTLKPATRRPRSVKAAIRPVATVVLPTPEWVPATTTLAVIGSPSVWRSPLDSLLAADALVEGMLELAHLGDEVGDLDQRRGASRPVMSTCWKPGRLRSTSTTSAVSTQPNDIG